MQCSGHTGFAPAHRCVLSPSTLLRLSAALYGACHALRAVSVFGSSTKVRTQLRLRFVPSLAGAAQAARSLTGALSPGAARLLLSAVPASVSACASRVHVPCVCSGELVSSHDPPGGCRPSRISGSLWLETGSLFAVWEGCCLWGRVCPFPFPLASCLRRGWASPLPASPSLELLSSFVLRTAGSVFGRVNFLSLSLSCYPTV